MAFSSSNTAKGADMCPVGQNVSEAVVMPPDRIEPKGQWQRVKRINAPSICSVLGDNQSRDKVVGKLAHRGRRGVGTHDASMMSRPVCVMLVHAARFLLMSLPNEIAGCSSWYVGQDISPTRVGIYCRILQLSMVRQSQPKTA